MMQPIVFHAAGGPCFGWYHPARAPRRGAGVVLCQGMGWEAICAYRTYLQLAHALAEAGFDVVRFDYHGTGESAGGDADPDRVAAWQQSIVAAIAETRRIAGVSRIALFGLRLGATLAAHAAAQIGGVDALVMWAPAVTGRAYARELKAGAQALSPSQLPDSKDLVALGCLYTEQTLQAMQALNCEQAERAPAPHVLIIGRDDLGVEGPLPARYRLLGANATYVDWPGYAAMMDEPHKAQLDPLLPARVAGWLSQALPSDPRRVGNSVAHQSAQENHGGQRSCPPYEIPAELIADGVRESALSFGADQSLFGMLTESLHAPQLQHETVVILVNVAGSYRVGPNRIYVKLSRALASAGYRAFRFDLPGMGDSRFEAGLCAGSLYNGHSTAEVRAAIDLMQARGCKRIWVLGICSGSFVAFNTAQVDPRVNGQILMNSRLLEWSEGRGNWETAMTSAAYKSTIYYRRALLMPEVYGRVLRGKVDVKGIANRVATLLGARIKRGFNRLLGRSAVEGVLPKMKQLSARGTDTLMIMSAHDDGLDYVEFHLGMRGNKMRGDPNFRFVIVDDSDHTFSPLASQRKVIETVVGHLESNAGKTLTPTLSPRGEGARPVTSSLSFRKIP
jgi:pimeloyl-ACP methyl ester carboxylesterase